MLYFLIVVLYITILLIINSFKKLVIREGYCQSNDLKDKILLNTVDMLENICQLPSS